MIKNYFFNITLILQQTNSNILFLIKNKTFLCFIIFLMFLSISIPIIFIPIIFGFAIVIQIATLIPIGICFAALSYNWRRSTLYKNMMIGKNNKYNQNISVLVTMFILCSVLTTIIISLIFVSSKFGILLTGGMTSAPAGGMHQNFNFENFQGGMLIYTQSVNVIGMFAYCFLFQRIIKTEKGFYTSILTLAIILFIFGGSFNDYFDGIEGGLLENSDKAISYGTKTVFPQSFFIVSLFVPFYSTAQVMSGSVNFFYIDNYTPGVWYTKDLSLALVDSGLVNNGGNSMTEGGSAWKWNILGFVPYIHILVFTGLGIIFSRKHQI